MLIDFDKIPNTNKLFLDYLNDFEQVKNYYNINFRNENLYDELFEKVSSRKNSNKSNLVSILLNYYEGLKCSNKTKQNIEFLNDEKTIAVFTGQQVGLLGGPLYTIYKAFTSIKLAEYLNTKFKEYNFVPIFWMAGDDHDYEEISFINLINKENELAKITLDDGKGLEINRGPVGDLQFDTNVLEFSNLIKSNIRETEFTNGLTEMIDNVLQDGLSIKESFFRLMYQIFDDTGLIIFDPQQKNVKELLKPIFKKELTDYKIHNKDLLLTSADLDDNYHAQVKIKPINLFYSDETGRHLIEPIEDEYRLKGKRKRFTKEEIIELVDNYPERFSGNVLLRPICEDYLFPTGFYIGGPGEISYYAQVIPLYTHYGLQHPIVFPRASATIIEGNIAKILIKYNLSSQDFFNGKKELKETVINALADIDLEAEFSNASTKISEILNNLSKKLTSIDQNLNNVSESTKNKISHLLEVMKNKSMKAQEQKFNSSLRQISKAQNLIYPNDNLQERELSIMNFVNKYGFEFFDWIYNELEIKEFKHQILEI